LWSTERSAKKDKAAILSWTAAFGHKHTFSMKLESGTLALFASPDHLTLFAKEGFGRQ
jgi:hypothetical protein